MRFRPDPSLLAVLFCLGIAGACLYNAWRLGQWGILGLACVGGLVWWVTVTWLEARSRKRWAKERDEAARRP